MTPLDWIISALPLVVVVIVGVYSRSYVRSVADFMTGGRSAGRYLLAIAGGELQAGVVMFVAAFELVGHSGFTLTWWGWLSGPVGIFLGLFGFVGFRYRETRVMTLAQFFEIRYSKSFRIFTGMLGFVAGLLNFGIIPALGARCVADFWGWPETLTILGHAFPTYICLMACFLSISAFVSLTGGLITVMVINCIEGMMSQLFYLVIIATLLVMFHWSQISHVLSDRPPGQSLLNPFDSSGNKDFNPIYTMMGLALTIYGTKAWQNASGYGSAAFSAHEGRMGGILGQWRELGKGAIVTFLAVCALTFLHDPHFAALAASAEASVHRLADPHVQEQMELPIAISTFLPIGVKGVLTAIFLMGIFGGDATHLHSWGSIFVQDVVVPLCRKPMSPKQHVRVLRFAIAGVALFAFLFGCFFHLTQYVNMWWRVTMTIYVGGAGSAIIGGLYWKKGTTTAAWAALLTGSLLSFGGIIAEQMDSHFPLNGNEVSFYGMLCAIAVYVVVSLATCRRDFDMDRMLHRGKYRLPDSPTEAAEKPARARKSWERFVGLDEFYTRSDKWIACALAGWSLFWSSVFIVGGLWNLVAPWPLSTWSVFWEIVGIGLPILIASITGVWFTWGGLLDIRDLFRRLRQERVDNRDDGTVLHHHNLNEEPSPVPRPMSVVGKE